MLLGAVANLARLTRISGPMYVTLRGRWFVRMFVYSFV